MNRRIILRTVGIAGATLAGCLDRAALSERKTYEECSFQSIISLNSLPRPARKEVKIALTEDVYESDEPLILDKVMDTTDSYLSNSEKNPIYYDPITEIKNDSYTLQIKKAYPETESNIGLSVKNEAEKQRKVTIRLIAGNEAFYTNIFNLSPGETANLSNRGVTYRYGVINVEVETEALSEETTWEVDEFGRGYFLNINDERISISGPDDMLDMVRCEWDRNGDLRTRG